MQPPVSSGCVPRAQITHGRLRITLPAPPPPLPVADQQVRRKLKALQFPDHNVSIPYGDYKSGRVKYWMLFYKSGGKRRRESRVSFAKLKARAEEIAINITNGRTAMSDFGQNDRASFLRCQELAAGVGAAIEILVAEAVEARKKNSRTTFVPQTCPELCAALLAVKRKEGKCGR